MGKILMKYYKYVAETKGLGARVELAKTCGVSSVRIFSIPDNEENIEKMKAYVKKITGKKAPEFD